MPLNQKKTGLSKKETGLSKKKAGVVVIVAAGCLAAAGAVAVAAPALKNSSLMPDAVSEHVFKEKTRAFATAADAPTKGDLAFVLPDWVPRDAKNVKVKVKTTGGAKLIRFTLTDAGAGAGAGAGGVRLPEGKACGAGAPHVGGPELDASWWPDRTPVGARAECGDHYQYRVAVRGDTVYAWTNGEVSASGA
ncbi:hypothetical protein ACFWZ2_09020 [Streptomyces sp. NPDC059002]|uniref:hypothetical protein n=1 Tax=Streptomyces sp. NPDC059002 TaxID=3346690 RepID=UPI0036874780